METFDYKMDIAEGAKRVRADIKHAVEQGFLPKGLKVSVRTSRYSMGESLDVNVTALPESAYEGCRTPAYHLNWRRVLWETANPHAGIHSAPEDARTILGEWGTTIKAKLHWLVDRYNPPRRIDMEDGSMGQRWHVSIGYDGDLDRACRERILRDMGEPKPVKAPANLRLVGG